MKKIFSCFTLQLIFILSCNTKKNELDKNKKFQTDSFLSVNILGKWGGLGEASPVWDIRKDSIYYFQHSKAYAYKVINKNIIIQFENSSAVLKNIKVNNDTLFFTDDAGIFVKGYRFK